MAKFCGKIGFASTSENPVGSGVWVESVSERSYRGDVTRNTRKRDSASQSINDDILINNTISIVADAYAAQNFFAMRYIRWMGCLWKITNIEVQRPRLILTIGGVYNGPTPAAPTTAE